jgi:hypothetical protein
LWSVIGEQIARAEAAEAESLRVAKEFVIGEGEAWRIVAEQRARAKAAEAKIAAIEALHVKITRYGNDYYSITQSDYEGDPSGYEDMEPFDLCAECYEVEKLICEECGGDCAIGHRSSWPCPTVAALQESEGE